MKFISKMGIGEIVIREHHKGNRQVIADRMMEVVAVSFSKEGTLYMCEDASNGIRQWYNEDDLLGDKDFNQDLGSYPKDL